MSQSNSSKNEDSSSCDRKRPLFCPSAQPGLDRSVVLAIVEDGPQGRHVSYLNGLVRVTADRMLGLIASPIGPTRLFRFAAPCESNGCRNWSGSHCRVVEKLVQILPTVTSTLPDCKLRPACRWFQQEGESACHRCPQVLTDDKHYEASLNQSGFSDSQCSPPSITEPNSGSTFIPALPSGK